MKKTLTGVFSAVAIISGTVLGTSAIADENQFTADTENAIILDFNSLSQLHSHLQQASDITDNLYRYNQWFLDQMMQGISQLYVEEVEIAELERLALQGVEELRSQSTNYTVDEFVEAALDGILQTLDPHSDYVTADEMREMMDQSRGGFVGIGVRIEMDEQLSLLKVVEPIDNSPADDAGVIAGDLITHINGESMQGKTIEDYTDRLRGRIGTDVDITIQRQGVDDPVDITITRSLIEANSPVIYDAIDNIGYIRITSFNGLTTAKLHEAVEELQDEIGESNVKGYVIDLRFNPGGLLPEAISVVDSFLNSGEIVATGDASGENLQFVQARNGDITNGAEIVVLVNGASASASEIVAGALQDHDRATVIGTQTFGKGSVQSVIPLGNYFRGRGDGMRITTQLYYTPSGDTIQNQGVTPDIRTEFQGTVSDGRIGQSEADLAGVIANPNLVQDDHETVGSCDSSGAPIDVSSLDDRYVFELRDGTFEPDYQLLCAVEYILDNPQYTQINEIDEQEASSTPNAPTPLAP